ncbi:MAG: TonB-dependent siderophore receptor [Cytophaga sp.]|nr:TonB-dependent siderophore receptor [Undibacterium sp.]
MSKPHLLYSIVAASIAQAFVVTPISFAQTIDKSLAEVIVTGSRIDKGNNTKASGFIDTPVLETPVSVTVFTQAQMQDLQIRQTSDAMKFDASVNDAYNAVGYAEQFSIRGFALDNSSSYRKDGFAIPGDASIPLENKERIEVLKGIAGFQAGFATPGGILNYVTKRPTSAALRSVTFEASERGTLYGAADLGGMSTDRQFGYRINVSGERLRSYIKGANGERQFVSGAFDWHLSDQALLQLDVDYQHKSQLTAPGFQLTNGTDLPRGIQADTMLNNQPWARPVDTRNSNIGLRFEYQLNADWQASVAANKHEFKRNDYTAFPYGCGSANLYPGYCANGDYDVYDYQSVNESKSQLGTQALLNGKFLTGAVKHTFAAGLSHTERHDYFGDYVYALAGVSNIYHPVAVVPTPGNKTGDILLRRTDKEWSAFMQDIISMSDNLKLHLGLRHLNIQRRQLVDVGTDSPHLVNLGYERSYLLPSLALVDKLGDNWSVYGAYSAGLEHGGLAPIATTNQHQFLDPAKSKQVEIGVKAELQKELSISAAVFRIQKPLEYIQTNNDTSTTYVSNGDAVHTGLEFSAQGKLHQDLRLGASLTAIDTKQKNTGDITLDGKHVTNVPSIKSTLWLDYTVPQVKGLGLNTVWQYSGSKAFSPDNSVTVPAYHVLNFGARYATQMAGSAMTVRFNVDNALNKFYWRDVTQSLGGYLFPGAPRTYKVSVQFDL